MIRPVAKGGKELGVTLIVEQLRRAVPGGIGTYARELVRALAGREDLERDRIELYASRAPRHDPLASLGLPLVTGHLPGPVMTRLWDLGLGRLRGASGIVHGLSFAVPPTDLPLVVTVHDLAFREVPEAFSDRSRRWHERQLRRHAKSAAGFVVPSEPVADALVGSGLGIERERVHVIFEGADHLGPGDLDRARARLLELGVGERFILSVGTIEPRKNLARLIAGFSTIRDRLDGPCSLVLCGPTGWMTGLSSQEDVVLAGQVDNEVLAALYQLACVVAYVPLHEGFGLPVVEAMHYGAVVCSSTVPSAGDATYLVDPYDVDAIGMGLARCVTDETLRAELRSRGSAHVLGLTWANTAERHLALWNEVGER